VTSKQRLRDTLEGGSVKYVEQERQGIQDLESRIVTIRTAIQRSNLETKTTVNDKTMSVAEWLTFRREVAASRQQFLANINNTVRAIRDKVTKDGGRVVAANVAATAIVEANRPPMEVYIHLDEKALLEEQEMLEKTLGDLDGKLSLLNATTVIDV